MLADPEKWTTLPDQVVRLADASRSDRSVLPRTERASGRDLPARQSLLHGRLSLRGPARPPDARHAAHPPARPGEAPADRLRRHRLFASRSGASAISASPSRARQPSLAELFDEDMLGDDLEAWMAESYLLKRMFRNCALISGLIEKRHPGKEKTGRQVTISTDLVYDVLLQARARPHPHAGRLGRRRHRPARHRPPRRYAHANQGPHRPQAPRPHLAARRSGDAGDRPRGGGRRRGRRARAARGGRGSGQGRDGRDDGNRQ